MLWPQQLRFESWAQQSLFLSYGLFTELKSIRNSCRKWGTTRSQVLHGNMQTGGLRLLRVLYFRNHASGHKFQTKLLSSKFTHSNELDHNQTRVLTRTSKQY